MYSVFIEDIVCVYDNLDPELQKEILGVQLEIEQWMVMDNIAMEARATP